MISTSVDQPKGGVVTRNGKFLYTANFKSGTVSASTFLSNGLPDIDTVATVTAGLQPKSVAVTGNSKYLYVANYGDNTIQGFGIDSSTGALELINTYPVGSGPKYLTTLA